MGAIDPRSTDATRPARRAVAVTLHDTNELSGGACRAFMVGTGGNVSAILEYDTAAVVLKNLVAGQIYPIAVRIFQSTSTTAADVVALY